MEKIIKSYNRLMMSLCLEYLTIDTIYSEGTEGWGIEEMRKEAKYQLSKYYEYGTSQASLKEYEPQQWRKETQQIKRFLKSIG